MESLARISASPKTGAEPFTAAGRPVDATVADFWGWSRSDLLDNTERGVLAEFIVATALGIPTDGIREGWAAWDLTTPGGIRVEVKSAAYLQSWAQKELSRISFSTPRTLAWDADGGGFADVARRHAQVYVFALLAHTDKATVNPLLAAGHRGQGPRTCPPNWWSSSRGRPDSKVRAGRRGDVGSPTCR